MARLWPVFSRKSVFTRQQVHIRGLGGTILPFWDLSALWLWASPWLENKEQSLVWKDDIVVRVQFGLISIPLLASPCQPDPLWSKQRNPSQRSQQLLVSSYVLIELQRIFSTRCLSGRWTSRKMAPGLFIIKESYSKEKWVNLFTNAFGQSGGLAPPP